jgi:hypothetical protein
MVSHNLGPGARPAVIALPPDFSFSHSCPAAQGPPLASGPRPLPESSPSGAPFAGSKAVNFGTKNTTC